MIDIKTPEVKHILREIYALPISERKYQLKRLRKAMTGKKDKPFYLWELTNDNTETRRGGVQNRCA